MPYVIKVCSNCGHTQNCYHNVKVCRSCQRHDMIVTDFPPNSNTDVISLQKENRVLRREVNHLRTELGYTKKYSET